MVDSNKKIIYDILVEECGAFNDEFARLSFYHNFPQCTEYRFQGKLGFGGKVWFNPSPNAQPIYVNCYPEDKNDERRLMISKANDRLAGLLL